MLLIPLCIWTPCHLTNNIIQVLNLSHIDVWTNITHQVGFNGIIIKIVLDFSFDYEQQNLKTCFLSFCD
jgi:hypothetical protein